MATPKVDQGINFYLAYGRPSVTGVIIKVNSATSVDVYADDNGDVTTYQLVSYQQYGRWTTPPVFPYAAELAPGEKINLGKILTDRTGHTNFTGFLPRQR